MPETTGSQAAQSLDVFVVLAIIPVFVALLRAMEISKMILRALHSVPEHAWYRSHVPCQSGLILCAFPATPGLALGVNGNRFHVLC